MNILVTGSKGMVGTSLCNNLKNIRDGKNKTRNIKIDEIYEYDIDSTIEQLEDYCSKCDFVFNLAGVNRPQNQEDFMKGNFGFASLLLDTLKKHNNKAGIMLSSSIQATLSGRFDSIFHYYLVIVNMVEVKKLEKNFSLTMKRKQVLKYMYIDFLT